MLTADWSTMSQQQQPKQVKLSAGLPRQHSCATIQHTSPVITHSNMCHITPAIQELHWLPVRRRLDLKMATLVYLSLSGMAPAYLAADCQLVSDEGRRQLRSATSRTSVVRRTYSNYGDRCFAAAGPKLWNSLPADL